MNILKNKWFILGNILLLLAIIPITLFVVKRQTELRSKAAPSTNLSFTPATADTAVGQDVFLDITVDPGQNVVSIVELNISVDPTKLKIVSLDNNTQAFPVKLKEPTIDNNSGTVTISMSTSNDVTQAIQKPTKAATLRLTALADSAGVPAVVKINQSSSQVFSLASADGATENVLASAGTAKVNIASAGAGGGTTNPGGSSSSVSPSPSPGAGGLSQKPTCSSLTTDKSTTGVAPYALVFTVNGSSSNSTIKSSSFNFGDGQTQVATSSGGLGTNAVNVQIAHTYNTPGNFAANASLTDALGNTSDASSCAKNIVVNSAAAAQPTPTSAPLARNPTPTLPVTGTLENSLAIAGGAILVIAVGLFFFVL